MATTWVISKLAIELWSFRCVFADPPEIEVERSWVHSGEGYQAQLVCIVHGEPPPEVSAINLNLSPT